MSKADVLFVNMCREIINNGFSTEGETVRARWEDGSPAYTIKTFGVVNRYNLQEEFPALTLRPTAIKSAMDEILWIWQRKSNNINDLKPHIWDEWADPDGSIGKAYGFQMQKKYKFAQGEMDQVDNVLWQLKNQPQSRRIMTNIYNFEDLHERHLHKVLFIDEVGIEYLIAVWPEGEYIRRQIEAVRDAVHKQDRNDALVEQYIQPFVLLYAAAP